MSDPVSKATRCKKLLDDPELQDAFKAVRERYRDLIEETPVSDDGALLDIRKMLHLLREVEDHLRIAVETGDLEQFRAKEQEGHGFLGDIRKWRKNAR